MVQTIINLDENQDRFLNVYKAKNGLKNKNDAVKQILEEYEGYLKRVELKEGLDKMTAKMEANPRNLTLEDIDKLFP